MGRGVEMAQRYTEMLKGGSSELAVVAQYLEDVTKRSALWRDEDARHFGMTRYEMTELGKQIREQLRLRQTPEWRAANKALLDEQKALNEETKRWNELWDEMEPAVMKAERVTLRFLREALALLGNIVEATGEWWKGKQERPPPAPGGPQTWRPDPWNPGKNMPPPPKTEDMPWKGWGLDWLFGKPTVPARQSGGPVAGGAPYMVGEGGPEMFVPHTSGSVVASAGARDIPVTLKDIERQGTEQSTYLREMRDALAWMRNEQETAQAAGGGAGAGAAGFGGGAGGGAAGGVAGAGGGPSGRSHVGASDWNPTGSTGLADENGQPIDRDTMAQAEALGRRGDTAGLQQLFAKRGFHMSGPACGIVASKYARAAGFAPPEGGAVATNWHKWGEQTTGAGINEPNRPFGSLVATYYHGRYLGKQGQVLGPGELGGHVMHAVPGTYDPHTNTAMFVDQYGARRRNLNDMDVRFAGSAAVAAVAARRGTTGGDGTAPPARDGAAGDGNQPAPNQPGADGAAPAGGHASNAIAAERARFFDQLNKDPAAKSTVAWLLGQEHGQSLETRKDVLESLANRAAATGKTPRQLLLGGFYGPLNRVGRRLMQSDPHGLDLYEQAASDVAAGRNVLGGRTDQGMPHEVSPTGRIIRSREAYGWMGIRREHQTAAAREARGERVAAPQQVAVNGSAKVEVHVKADPGTKATKTKANGTGSLKDVNLKKTSQMAPAASTSSDEE
jgi:hypothetical protein